MTIESSNPSTDRKQPSTGAIADVVVPLAMLVVAVACGLASHLHFGFVPEFAAANGLALFCIMLLGHVLLRSDPAGSDFGELQQTSVASPLPAAPHSGRQTSRPSLQPSAQVTGLPETASSETEAHVKTSAGKATPAAAPPLSVLPSHALGLRPAFVDQPESAAVEIENTAAQAIADHLTVLRPSAVSRPTPSSVSPSLSPLSIDVAEERRAESTITSGPQSRHAPVQPLSQQQHVEHILKRLADQIRAGGGDGQANAFDAEPVASDSGSTAAIPPLAVRPITPAAQPVHATIEPRLPHPDLEWTTYSPDTSPAGDEPDSALAEAVNTLRSTVESMRGAMRGAPPPPRTPTPAEIRLAAVAEALAAERSNVYLQPILGLNDDSASHFEVSVRLITSDGEVLDRQQITADVRGAGLLPLLDAIGVRHGASFALKLERRGRDGAVFSPIAGESLENERFVTEVAGRQSQGVADRLILTFAQEEIRGLGVVQMSALAELARLGFRFAIERLSHLDMDFEALKANGFSFVKLDASVFTDGLALGGSLVPADDLCRFFREHRLDVIAGRIEDDEQRCRMIDYGVQFGQGRLFGEPRPIPIGTLEAGDRVAA